MFHFSEINESITENTVYGIASVSKHFTSTLLGQTLKKQVIDKVIDIANVKAF